MSSIVFYHNQQAGKGALPHTEEELRKFFFRHEIDFRYPQSRTELLASLDRDLIEGKDYIFSVGGDGTANTIAQKLLHKKTRLLVIPSGTANDFAGALGLTSSIRSIADVFHSQHTRLVDVLSVNGQVMLTNGGLGIAATVAAEINHKRKSGQLFKGMMHALGSDIYGFQLLQHLLTRPFPINKVKVHSPDAPSLDVVESPLILVNNQPLLGAKFRVAPQTVNDDGTFNVAIFHHPDKMSFIQTVTRILRAGMPSNDPYITTFETKHLRLCPLRDEPLDFFGDGEQFASAKAYDIELIPRCLRVCAMNDEPLFHQHDQLEIPKLQ